MVTKLPAVKKYIGKNDKDEGDLVSVEENTIYSWMEEMDRLD